MALSEKEIGLHNTITYAHERLKFWRARVWERLGEDSSQAVALGRAGPSEDSDLVEILTSLVQLVDALHEETKELKKKLAEQDAKEL